MTGAFATPEARHAAIGLWVLGGLNLLGGVGLIVAGFAPAGGLSLLAGLVLMGLGFGARTGARAALIAALVVLALLVVWSLVGLGAGDGQALVRFLVCVVLLWLVVRALRSGATA